MGQLQGKVAFVTGAGRGIGRAIADRLAKDGAAVAVISRTQEQVEKTAAGIFSRGGRSIGFACDLGVPGAPAAAIERTQKELGPIDILINHAHNTDFGAMTGEAITITPEKIDAQMVSGPYAALALMRACFPHMQAKGGRVINMASSAGTKGMAGFLPYARWRLGHRRRPLKVFVASIASMKFQAWRAAKAHISRLSHSR